MAFRESPRADAEHQHGHALCMPAHPSGALVVSRIAVLLPVILFLLSPCMYVFHRQRQAEVMSRYPKCWHFSSLKTSSALSMRAPAKFRRKVEMPMPGPHNTNLGERGLRIGTEKHAAVSYTHLTLPTTPYV